MYLKLRKNIPGVFADVWIDTEAGLVKKNYRVGGVTVGNNKTLVGPNHIQMLFENDIHWSKTLEGPYTVKTLEYGPSKEFEGFYQIQEYLGPDLLDYYIDGTLHERFPTIIDQLVEMYTLYQKHDVYKFNGSLSNLTGKDGKIKAFDFKYMRKREPRERHIEWKSVMNWLSKAGPDVLVIHPLLESRIPSISDPSSP